MQIDKRTAIRIGLLIFGLWIVSLVFGNSMPPPPPVSTSISGNSAIAPDPPSSSEPYDDIYKNSVTSKYMEHQADFKELVSYVYFALGCRALKDEVSARAIWGSAGQKLTMEAVQDELPQPKIDIEAARQDGIARANAPDGCDYWRRSPDEVIRLRQEANAAEMASMTQ